MTDYMNMTPDDPDFPKTAEVNALNEEIKRLEYEYKDLDRRFKRSQLHRSQLDKRCFHLASENKRLKDFEKHVNKHVVIGTDNAQMKMAIYRKDAAMYKRMYDDKKSELFRAEKKIKQLMEV